MLDKTNLHSLIKDKELLREKGYIGGNWIESLSSKKFLYTKIKKHDILVIIL